MLQKSLGIKENIYKIKNKLENTGFIGNLIDIERYKRKLYIKICNLKVQSEVTSNNVLRLKLGFKLVVSEAISIRNATVSSDLSKLAKPLYLPLTVAPFSEKDKFLEHPGFLYLKHGSLTLPMCRNDECIIIEERDRHSLISYSLNSNDYDNYISSLTESFKEMIENQLYINEHFEFHASNYEENHRKDDFRRLYGDRISISTTVYHAKYFEAYRKLLYGPDFNLIPSIIKSEFSEDTFGPKKFFLSNDHRFLLKIITEQDFLMFQQFAPNYFKHIYRHFYKNMNSRLLKIIGCFKVIFTNHYNG